MKKVVLLMLLMLLLFGGCSKTSGENQFRLEQMKANISFFEGERRISGELSYQSPEKIILKLTEPKEIENCVFRLENGVLSFGLDESECSLESLENLFGGEKGIQSLFESLSSAGTAEKKVFAGNVRFDCAAGEAVISLDENGEIETLRVGIYDYAFTPGQDVA